MIHGTRGFINQVTQTVVCNRNFNFYFEKMFDSNNQIHQFIHSRLTIRKSYKPFELVIPIIRKNLSNYQVERFRQKYNIDLTEETVITSSRCIINKIEFHSLSWSRSNKKNDYTICYRSEENEAFGMIEFFFEVNENIYAIVNIIPIEKNLKKIFKPNNFEKFVNEKNFTCFFNLIDDKNLNNRQTIIKTTSIICKCMIIPSEIGKFITKIAYNFEHD